MTTIVVNTSLLTRTATWWDAGVTKLHHPMRTETAYHTLECAAEGWIEVVVTSERACRPTIVEDPSIGTCC